jgi:hypothetical protein
MECDEENIFVTGLEEKYAARPHSLENWCLALFASVFTFKKSSCNTKDDIQPDLQLQEQVQEQSIHVEFDVNSSPDTIRIQTKCDTFTMKKRSKQAMIRYHKFSILREPDSYYYSELYLYIPWRTEDQLLGRYDSYKEHYEDVLQQITSARSSFQLHASLIDNTIQDFIENGPRDTEWDLLAPEIEQERMDTAASAVEVDPLYEILNPDQLVEEEFDNIPVETTITHCPISSDSSVPTLLPEDEYLNIVRSLNVKQRQLFQVVLDWSISLLISPNTIQTPFNYFVTGGAGTGKSHLIRALHQMVIRTLRREGDDPTALKVLLMAPTGTAAHNIDGLTIHSALQLQLGQSAKTSYHRLGDEKRNTLRCKYSQLHLIIIDEISMVGSDLLLQIHRRLQEIFQSSLDFGGISLLAFGDLYQLPPVCQKFIFQPPSDEYAQLCVQLWDNFKLFELTEVLRQQDDAPFANLLSRVRDGTHNEDDIKTLNTRNNCSPPPSTLHIFATYVQVDNYNLQKLDELSGQILSINSIDIVPETMKNRKFPEDQRFTGGLTSVLQLKLGCRIMLTRNLDVADGLSNGAQGTLTGILKNANNNQVNAILVRE